MLEVMDSFPFYFDSVHGGFSSCAGLLHVTAEGLRCEYRVDVGGLGLKTGGKEASVRLDEIESIDFKRGWFRAKAVIRPKSLKLLDRFPVSGDDSVLLYFKRKDRKLAEYLISEVRLKLSQSRLEFLTRPRRPAHGPDPSFCQDFRFAHRFTGFSSGGRPITSR